MIYSFNLLSNFDSNGSSYKHVNSNIFDNNGLYSFLEKNSKFIMFFRNWYLFGYFSGPWNIANFILKNVHGNQIVLRGCSWFNYYPITLSYGEVKFPIFFTNTTTHNDLKKILEKKGFNVIRVYSLFATIISIVFFHLRLFISLSLVVHLLIKYFFALKKSITELNTFGHYALVKSRTHLNNYVKTGMDLEYIYIDDKPSIGSIPNCLSSRHFVSSKSLLLRFYYVLKTAGLINVLKHDALYPALRIAIYMSAVRHLNDNFPDSRVLTGEVLFPYNHENQENVDLLLLIDLPEGEYFPCDVGIETCYYLKDEVLERLRGYGVISQCSQKKITLLNNEFSFSDESNVLGFFTQPILLDEEREIINDIALKALKDGYELKLYLHPRSKRQDYIFANDQIVIGKRGDKISLKRAYSRTSSIGVELEMNNIPVVYCLYGSLKKPPLGSGENGCFIYSKDDLL